MIKMTYNWIKAQLSTINREEGQGMVEYALIIAFIALVVIAGLVILGPIIKNMFIGIGDELTTSAP